MLKELTLEESKKLWRRYKAQKQKKEQINFSSKKIIRKLEDFEAEVISNEERDIRDVEDNLYAVNFKNKVLNGVW